MSNAWSAKSSCAWSLPVPPSTRSEMPSWANRKSSLGPPSRTNDTATTEIGRRRVGKECRSRWSPYHNDTATTEIYTLSLHDAFRSRWSPYHLDGAFRRLFDLYSPRLYHFFSRRGFSHSDCLDLTQETFLGIYKGVGAFRQDSSFETWLFKIATNAYRKRLRWGIAGKRDAPEVPLEESPEKGRAMAAIETLAATDLPAPGE